MVCICTKYLFGSRSQKKKKKKKKKETGPSFSFRFKPATQFIEPKAGILKYSTCHHITIPLFFLYLSSNLLGMIDLIRMQNFSKN